MLNSKKWHLIYQIISFVGNQQKKTKIPSVGGVNLQYELVEFSTTILGLMCNISRALVYHNFLKEVRFGGWGTEGPKAPTLGRHVSECASIIR